MGDVNSFRVCNLCGSTEPERLFNKDGYSVVRCRRCSLVYVGDELESIDFAALYGKDYYLSEDKRLFSNYLAEEPERLASARSRVEKLKKLKKTGRLLDVGCAAGFFLEAAKPYYDVVGVDLSEYSSSYARERFGLNVLTGNLEQAELPENSFDVVTLWDVIEHVADPLAVMCEVGRILRPGGIAVVATGDIESLHARIAGENWPLLAPPWHLYYFSRKTLKRLGEGGALSLCQIKTQGVISTYPLLNNRWVNRAVNFLRIGDIMQVVFRK